MSVFIKYARYYDLLYKDKDYSAEGAYIHHLIQTFAPKTSSILELGCGTGIHAVILAERGYQVHGVDQSAEMLGAAARRVSQLGRNQASRLSFSTGDIRSLRIGRKFDAVISLFHVISYQATQDDLVASFATAKSHLAPGGIFIFDCWYGPAVVSQKPAVRVKRLEDEQIEVTRIAEPVMHPAENIVDVNYQVFIRNKADQTIEELRETHRMRYLFDHEIDSLLAQQGLMLLDRSEWLSGKMPGVDTWGVCFVVQA